MAIGPQPFREVLFPANQIATSFKPIFSNNSTLGDRKRISEEDGRPTLKIKRAPFEVLYSWQYTQLQVSIRAYLFITKPTHYVFTFVTISYLTI